jgi:hypothetical protein
MPWRFPSPMSIIGGAGGSSRKVAFRNARAKKPLRESICCYSPLIFRHVQLLTDYS